jgi:hydrogenase nickel incorporation protein HypA/HybF
MQRGEGHSVHELSVAVSLVEMASEKAASLGDVRVEALHVRLGPLSGVVKESLLFCFDVAAEGTAVEGARLEIEEVPLTGFCPRCGAEREVAAAWSLGCPVCDTPVRLLNGRELELAALEVEDNAAAHR